MSPRPTVTFIVKHQPDGKLIRFAVKTLDTATICACGAELDRVADEVGSGQLHMDLGQVRTLTGAALGKIVAMSLKVRDAGGEFVVRNVNDFLFELFEITRLNTVMSVRRKQSRATELLSV